MCFIAFEFNFKGENDLFLGVNAFFSSLVAYWSDLMQKTELKWLVNTSRPWACCYTIKL